MLNGIRQYKISVCKSLHKGRGTQPVCSMIREISLPKCIQAGDSCHHLIINPDPSHGVMNCRIDHHRVLIRILINDLFIHLEKIAVPFFDYIFPQTFNRFFKIKKYGQASISYAIAGITAFLGRTGSYISRNEIPIGWVPSFKIIISVFFFDIFGLYQPFPVFLSIFFILWNPYPSIIPQAFAHQR